MIEGLYYNKNWEGGAHSKLPIQRDEGVGQHHEERAPEVGAVSDGRSLPAGGGEGEQDAPKLGQDIAHVDVQLLSANSRRTMPNTGTLQHHNSTTRLATAVDVIVLVTEMQ